MAISTSPINQYTSGTSTSVQNPSITVPSIGNTLIALVSSGTGTTISLTSITQTGVNWHYVIHETSSNGQDLELWYGIVVGPTVLGGLTTVWSGSPGFWFWNITEWSGIMTTSSPVDGSGGLSGTSLNPAVPPFSTSYANDLVIAACNCGQTETANPNNFTPLTQVGKSGYYWMQGDYYVPAPSGPQGSGETWTIGTSNQWVSVGAGFQIQPPFTSNWGTIVRRGNY